MLQKLREKSTGVLATAILALLVVPFAFFGMEQYTSTRTDTYVARIQSPPKWWSSAPQAFPASVFWTKHDVSTEQFRAAFEQARQRERTARGEAFDPQAFETLDNKRRVLDTLIDQQVMQISAVSAGVAIGDDEVRAAIEAIPAFQVDGKFNAQRYQLALNSQIPPQVPTQFQQGVRDNLQQLLIPTEVANSAFVTDSEIDRLLALIAEQRDVSFVVLPTPAVDTAAVTPAQVKAWFDANAGDYRAPETVSIEYVDIDARHLPAAAAADDAALLARYEQEKARFVEPEQRLVSHLLVRVDTNATPAQQQAAQAKATQFAVAAAKPGADFAALAQANSDDTGSRAAGGDLGWVQKGVMPAAFDTALFGMQPGQVLATPVRTDFGWHVLQLREVRAGKQVPFEQARAELAREQGTTDQERSFNDLVGKLVDQVYKNPSTLAPAARAVGLPVLTAGPFTRNGGDGIAADAGVQRAAFSDALVQDGTVSDAIEIAPGHNVMIRVVSHSPERALTLAQATPKVTAAIRADRTNKAATAAADAMVAAIAGGQDLKAVAASRGLVANDVANVQRGMPVPDEAASEAYFAALAPAAGKVTPGRLLRADGSAVVYVVHKVTPGDAKQAPAQQRTQLRDQLAQMRGNSDVENLVAGQRKRLRVDIHEDRL